MSLFSYLVKMRWILPLISSVKKPTTYLENYQVPRLLNATINIDSRARRLLGSLVAFIYQGLLMHFFTGNICRNFSVTAVCRIATVRSSKNSSSAHHRTEILTVCYVRSGSLIYKSQCFTVFQLLLNNAGKFVEPCRKLYLSRLKKEQGRWLWPQILRRLQSRFR
jgi:hypothetical protein